MMQQQFIIQELSNDSENISDNESSAQEIKFENSEDDLSMNRERFDNSRNKEIKIGNNDDAYARNLYSNKISFAIFGSFTSQFTLGHSKLYKKYCHAAQSGFRTLGLVKPDNTMTIDIVLSCEGFRED